MKKIPLVILLMVLVAVPAAAQAQNFLGNGTASTIVPTTSTNVFCGPDSVTLSAGAGTITDACIQSTYQPVCVDTTASNAFTVVPGTGSATVAGIGSDVITCSFLI